MSQFQSCVEIRLPPVTWRIVHADPDDVRVFYDDYHLQLLFVTKQRIFTSDFHSPSLTQHKISIPNHHEVRNAKFSSDRQLLAAQTSSNEMKVLDNRGRLIALRQCGQGRAILNFYWIQCEFAHLMVITTGGPEFYKISSSKLKRERHLKYPTVHYWYLPQHQFLLLVDKHNIFQSYTITAHSIPKLSKFEIVSSSESSLDASKPFYHQIQLFDIYGKIACTFVDEIKGQVHIFGLDQGVMQHMNRFQLASPGHYAMSVVDNILVVHDLRRKLPMLFDISQAPEKRSRDSVLPPQPIFSLYHEGPHGPSPTDHSRSLSQGDASTFEAKTQQSTPKGDGNENSLERREPSSRSDSMRRKSDSRRGSTPRSSRSREHSIRRARTSTTSGDLNNNSPVRHFLSDEPDAAASPRSRNSARSHHPSSGSGGGNGSSGVSAARTAPGGVSVQTQASTSDEPLYSNCWEFLPPNYILEIHQAKNMCHGRLYQLSLNLQAVVEFWGHQPYNGLIEFLSKREPALAKPLMIKVVRDLVDSHVRQQRVYHEDPIQLDTLSRLFSRMNKACALVAESSWAYVDRDDGYGAHKPDLPRTQSLQVKSSRDDGRMKHKSGTLPRPRASSPQLKPRPHAASPPVATRLSSARRRDTARSFDETMASSRGSLSVADLRYNSSSSDVVIGQVDMYNHIFVDFSQEWEGKARRRFVGVLIEYIRSVGRSLMVPIDPLMAMLIDLLMGEGMHYELHQLLQYHIIQDSESLASRLLDIEEAYPPAYQLAIDMYARMKEYMKLSRLLLSRNKVLTALELMNTVALAQTVNHFPSAREFLAKADEANDSFVFYTTFSWFLRRNVALTNTPRFQPNEECEEFERKFCENIEVS